MSTKKFFFGCCFFVAWVVGNIPNHLNRRGGHPEKIKKVGELGGWYTQTTSCFFGFVCLGGGTSQYPPSHRAYGEEQNQQVRPWGGSITITLTRGEGPREHQPWFEVWISTLLRELRVSFHPTHPHSTKPTDHAGQLNKKRYTLKIWGGRGKRLNFTGRQTPTSNTKQNFYRHNHVKKGSSTEDYRQVGIWQEEKKLHQT